MVVFNSMLTGLCKEGSITEALQIFELMKNKDHHSQTWPNPDYITYRILTTCLFHQNKKRKALARKLHAEIIEKFGLKKKGAT